MELILNVLHILCGVFWAGAALMIAGFIEPVVHALGPDGGKFMQRLMGPQRFPVYMTTACLVTVATGIALLWAGSGPNLGHWLASNYGKLILAGSAAGVCAMVLGLGVNAPTAARLAKLGGEIQAAGRPPSDAQRAELATLQGRLQNASRLSAVLLTIAVVTMAAADHF